MNTDNVLLCYSTGNALLLMVSYEQIQRELMNSYSTFSVEGLLDEFARNKHTGMEKPCMQYHAVDLHIIVSLLS